MAVTETYIQGPPQSTGEKIDVTQVTNAAGVVVDRESAVIADPEDAKARAAVRNREPSVTEYAGTVRVPGLVPQMVALADILSSMVIELRVIQKLLVAGLNVTENVEAMRRDEDVTDPPSS